MEGHQLHEAMHVEGEIFSKRCGTPWAAGYSLGSNAAALEMIAWN